MKLGRKIFVLLCAMLLILSNSFFVTAEVNQTEQDAPPVQPISDSFTLIEENESLALYVDTTTANIAVLEKKTNEVWKAYRDDIITSSYDSKSSIMDISYRGGNDLLMKVGSNSNAYFEIRKIANGCKFIFTFETQEATFTIPFKVLLHNDFLEIIVLYNEIKEKGEGRLADISLLPNWGAGNATEDGYVFIPDGSGAIIEYSDAVSRSDVYSADIYGNDPSQDLVYPRITDNENIRLPIYGIRHNNCAELTIITGGDASATINASMSNNMVMCNASFVFRESDLTGLQDSEGASRNMTILQSKHLDINPTIRKYFLTDENANYSGMARKYREYIVDKYKLKESVKKSTPAVSIEAFGAVIQTKSFIGIPYKSVLVGTKFSELEAFAEKLNEAGISDTPFYLYGFLNGGFEGTTNVKMKYINKLGGNKGYEKFAKAVGEENVYTVFDIQRSFGRSFDFFRSKDYTKCLSQMVVERHYYNLASEKWNTNFGTFKYYTVDMQKKLFSKLLKNLPKESNIVLANSGSEIMSDFSTNGSVNREDYITFLNQVFKKCDEKDINLAFESGNIYTAKYANALYEIPLNSSGYSIESYEVPFFAMVFHGLLPLSSDAVNNMPNTDAFLLKAFEQGVSATWRVIGENPNKFKNTKLNFLYNSQIDNIYDNAISFSEDYNKVHSVLYNKQIIDHSYYDGLSITTYENGWKVVCNYGSSQATYENQVIDVADYALIQ